MMEPWLNKLLRCGAGNYLLPMRRDNMLGSAKTIPDNKRKVFTLRNTPTDDKETEISFSLKIPLKNERHFFIFGLGALGFSSILKISRVFPCWLFQWIWIIRFC